MWNRGIRFLWIKFQMKDKKLISIPLPIPLYIFQELLDCFVDVLTVAGLIAPKLSVFHSSENFSIHSAKILIISIMKILDSLAGDEPYELVDVTTDEVRVIIKVR